MSPRMELRGVKAPVKQLPLDFKTLQGDFIDVPSENMLISDPKAIDTFQDLPSNASTDRRFNTTILDVSPVLKHHSYALRPRKPRRTAFNVEEVIMRPDPLLAAPSLESHGFIVNPMDICLFNKTLNGVQSCEDPSWVSAALCWDELRLIF
eukprot:gene11268-23574_t